MSIVQSASPLAGVSSGNYLLDPDRTTVKISAKTNWGLQTVRATFRLDEGGFRLDEEGNLVDVAAVIDAASFFSRNGKRDRHVKSSDFLDVERYPKISFQSQRSSHNEEDAVVLDGIVTIHGITEPVAVRVRDAAVEDGVARFSATARLDRMRFGVSHLPRRVGKQIDLSFDVVATRA
jgi:polyisoprenoid-binding protein YceI